MGQVFSLFRATAPKEVNITITSGDKQPIHVVIPSNQNTVLVNLNYQDADDDNTSRDDNGFINVPINPTMTRWRTKRNRQGQMKLIRTVYNANNVNAPGNNDDESEEDEGNDEDHENNDDDNIAADLDHAPTSRDRIRKKTDAEDAILKAGLGCPVEHAGDCDDGCKTFRACEHEDKVYSRVHGLPVDDYSDAFWAIRVYE